MKMKWILIVFALVIVVVGVLSVGIFETYEVKATAEQQFIIASDFVTLRKKLVRGNVLEQLVEAQNGKLISHQWDNFGFGFDKIVAPLNTWELSAKGQFQVRSSNDDIGTFILTLNENALVKPNSFRSQIESAKPVKSLRYYQSEMDLEPYGKQTLAKMKVSLVIQRDIPKFGSWRDHMTKKVNEAAEASIARTKEAFRRLAQ